MLNFLQFLGELYWRQRSTGSGKESESQPLTTEPEVRAELCMSFSEEGKEEGGGRREEGGGGNCISHPKVLCT